MRMQIPVTFRPGPLRARLEAGRTQQASSPGAVAKRDLAMYYDLLRDGLRSVALTTDEALILCAVVAPSDRNVQYIDWGAFDGGDSRKYLYDYLRWQISEEYLPSRHRATWRGLLAKVESWSELQALSVLDGRIQVSNLPDEISLVRGLERIGLLHAPAADPDPELETALVAYRGTWFHDELNEMLELQSRTSEKPATPPSPPGSTKG
jgi:hypothetical protein